jgi:acyl carrier protein
MSDSAPEGVRDIPKLEGRIRRLIAEHTGGAAAEDEIEWDTPIIGRGIGLTSLDTVSLMIRIENEFDLFLDAEEFASSLDSFGSLVEAIRRSIEGETKKDGHAL